MNRFLLLGLFVLLGWSLYGNATAPVVVTDDLPFATLSTQSPADPNLAQSLNTPAAADATRADASSVKLCRNNRKGASDVTCGEYITAAVQQLGKTCSPGFTVKLAECTIKYESYDGWVFARASNPVENGGDAFGLMQLLRDTFRKYRTKSLPDDPFDAKANVFAGVKYQQKILKETGCNAQYAAIAYHAGEDGFAKWKSGLPQKKSGVGPKTLGYAQRVSECVG